MIKRCSSCIKGLNGGQSSRSMSSGSGGHVGFPNLLEIAVRSDRGGMKTSGKKY
jgi:hypothetical protein